MAKFCGCCGTQAVDEAKVCGNCGTPFPGMEQYSPAGEYLKKKQQKNVKTIIGIVIGVLVASLLIGGGVKITKEFTGTKGIVRKVMKAYQTGEAEGLLPYISDSMKCLEQYSEKEYGLHEISSQIEEDIEYIKEVFEEEVGSDYKITYEITREKKMKNSYLKNLKENMKNWEYGAIGFDPDCITEAKEVKVKMKAKGEYGTEKKELYIILLKENKKWKIFEMY